MNVHEALAVLRKDEEEDRNWRSARSKLTELLTACVAAEATERTLTQRHASLESDVATSRAALSTLDADYQVLQKQYGQLDQQYRDKKQTLEASLNTVRGDLDAANQLKQELDDALALLKAKLT